MNLFFLFYLVAVYFLLSRLSFFKKSELAPNTLFTIFAIKYLAGLFYSYYFSLPTQIENADTWNYFIESKAETDWLLNNPKSFFADLFTNHYSQTGGFFSCTQSYWNDLKATFFIKTLAVLNLFSCKNYYINLLFFNVLFMFGGVAFYRLFNEHFVTKKWLLIGFVFFAPSFLFWCSGIHKDGIVFASTSIIFLMFQSVLKNKLNWHKLVVLLLCLAVIFLLRNYYLLAILPSLFGWFIVNKFNYNAKKVFGLVIATCLLVFFLSNSIQLFSGISTSIVEKHNEFKTLTGNTKFATPSLEAKTASLISYFPFALKYTLLKPYLTDQKFASEILVILENYGYFFLMIVALFFAVSRKNEVAASPIVLACLTTSFLLLIFIGYTVCFDAAIVRYRSVSLPLTIVPCMLIVFGKINNNLKISKPV